MVDVKGYPGPLYPPDAPGHPASPDSPLALMYKRAAARCGAWPWTPDEWDDSYSNRFAHGDTPPGEHAGMAGMQRWSGTIEPTGNAGEASFNFFRSVKVPQGKTHAGEMAMDSVCVQLANQAWDAANPPPAPQKTQRVKMHEKAVTQIGVSESPAGSNQVKYSDWYGMVGPWCAMFVTWCYAQVGGNDSFDRNAARYAYVPYIVSDARNGRYGLSVTGTPAEGDLVCYDWAWDGEYDHVGVFEEWTSGHVFTAVEGNTSTSDNSNGGQVMRRSRDVTGQSTVFVRVAE
jgi:hypothetical protein